MQEFREPLYLLDRPVWIEDTRSEEERKYPELFRRKLEGGQPQPLAPLWCVWERGSKFAMHPLQGRAGMCRRPRARCLSRASICPSMVTIELWHRDAEGMLLADPTCCK